MRGAGGMVGIDEDVLIVAFIGQHLLQTTDLSFDPLQPTDRIGNRLALDVHAVDLSV